MPEAKADQQRQAQAYGRIAVIGAGSWGTALACVARRAGREVCLWGRDAEVVAAINARSENPRYLPGIPLEPGLTASIDLEEAVAGAEAVMVVTPSVTIRDICRQLQPNLASRAPIALCAKGIEAATGLLLTEVAAEELPDRPVGALSGPTFAHETILGHPTAATVAFPFTEADRQAPRQSVAARFALSVTTPHFRPYITDDVTGVEIGGAVKNVIAIAAGMMQGAGFAENTRAALITRGMNEMKVLADALGGRRETVTGLSGVGDLILTCSSETSRNMSLGAQLGRGTKRADCFDGRPVVVEGEVTARSVIDLARRIEVELPICRAVYEVLHEGRDMRETLEALLSRPIRSETRHLDIALDHPSAAGRAGPA